VPVRDLLGLLGYPLRWARLAKSLVSDRGFLHVLIYHDIPPGQRDAFAAQICFSSREYNFVSPKTAKLMLLGEVPVTGANLLLTFDDGLRSNRAIADDILRPAGIQALFFVVSDLVGIRDRAQQKAFIADRLMCGNIGAGEVADDVAPMGWDDLRHLLQQGHSIGAHTRTHARLSSIADQQELEREIVGSGDELSANLQIPIDCFAYPFGDIGSIGPEALQMAAARYRFVFSGIRGGNGPAIPTGAIRREAVSLELGPAYCRFVMEGGLSPLYLAKRKRLDSFLEVA